MPSRRTVLCGMRLVLDPADPDYGRPPTILCILLEGIPSVPRYWAGRARHQRVLTQ
jgi:hypothetical protein